MKSTKKTSKKAAKKKVAKKTAKKTAKKKTSTELVKVEPCQLTEKVVNQIDTINLHWNTAEFHHQQSCGHLIMAGHHLIDLKKQTKHGQWGAYFDNSNSNSSWNFKFSQEWARKLMQMAEMSKKKLKDLSNLPFDKNLSEWTEDQLETLRKTVIKRGDGETFKQLALDWGIAKQPQGSGVKGGNVRNNNDDDDEEEEMTMRQFANLMFSDPVKKLSDLRSHVDYSKAISALPLAGDDPESISLVTLERDLESMLHDVKKAKEQAAKEITQSKS